MGLFGWLASHWTPAYEYREYYGNEVEYIAWESTTVGSRRGFLLGFPAGALVTVAAIGGAVMTGLYTPPDSTPASREGQQAAAASRATKEELYTLWEENQELKKRLESVAAAAVCPPCRPQAVIKDQPQPRAVAATPQPSRQGVTTGSATPKTGGMASGGETARPSTPQRVETPPRVEPAPTVPASVAKTEIAPRAAPLGMAIVEVRTSQGQFVSGVPIAFGSWMEAISRLAARRWPRTPPDGPRQ